MERNNRKVYTGVVSSTKCEKTAIFDGLNWCNQL